MNLTNTIQKQDLNLRKAIANFDSKEFTSVIKVAAREVKNVVVRKAKNRKNKNKNKRNNQKRLFVVIHLRGRDRKCALSKYTNKQLINKIESFGVFKNNSIVYLMTDLLQNNSLVSAVGAYFGSFILQEKDIELFKRRAFTKLGPFLVYATELELQSISDGVIRTYTGHSLPNDGKELGFLEPPECRKPPNKLPYLRMNNTA